MMSSDIADCPDPVPPNTLHNPTPVPIYMREDCEILKSTSSHHFHRINKKNSDSINIYHFSPFYNLAYMYSSHWIAMFCHIDPSTADV